MADLSKDLEFSLKYSEFLQKAIFPKQRHFDRIFEDSFVLFKPLHYVSGDFFWLTEINGLIYIATGDCTGHGVSGAILSVLTYSLLDYAILNKRVKRVHKILMEVDKRFTESFSSFDVMGRFDNDWVDISICCIDTANLCIHFAGARRDLLLVSEGNPRVIKGSKYPIGGWQINCNRTFCSKQITYRKGDSLYLGTDGFQDQVGGPSSKTFSTKRLHGIIASIAEMPMQNQKETLERELHIWKGAKNQTDDICIVGLRL